MKAQRAKLEAHASHLLTAFIQLRERYALLHPMLFTPHVPVQYGSYRQARGFAILKNSLFLSCCQDIAKLSTDNFDKTPSIKKLLASLEDDSLRAECRAEYCIERSALTDPDYGPGIVEALKGMAREEARRRGTEFDAKYLDAQAKWSALSISPTLQGFRTIRDKVSAHTEVRFVAEEYQLVDIGALGIKWGDLKTTIGQMQELVEVIGLLIRCSSFAWQSLDQMLAKAGNDFWIAAPAIATTDTV